jgi:hypothetical protein
MKKKVGDICCFSLFAWQIDVDQTNLPAVQRSEAGLQIEPKVLNDGQGHALACHLLQETM